MELTMPKWLVAQLNTHRCFSRNSASSRAIPLQRLRAQVLENPYIPSEWPRNQKGMEGGAPISEEEAGVCNMAWRHALVTACNQHEMLERMGVHKEVANRLLEPFMWTKVVLTGTDWSNFFSLRLPGAGAQHEMGKLAMAMKEAITRSDPKQLKPGQWHLPYSKAEEGVVWDSDAMAKSVACCARVSYLNHGKDSKAEDDIRLTNQLRASGHWSPFEHQAMALSNRTRSRNFRGWRQYRELTDD